MEQPLYISRKLIHDNSMISQDDLLTISRFIIVLAEPGMGKTSLLEKLACSLGITTISAKVFSCIGAQKEGTPLIIDAFDELAKTDISGVNALLAKIAIAKPTCVIISSRSAEWDNSATHDFEQFIGKTPTIVRLNGLNESEQKDVYIQHTNLNNFAEFRDELVRLSLEPLLPNPQFLKMFSDAYIESSQKFTDKSSVFKDAIIHLAREGNATVKQNYDVSIEEKIDYASELFLKGLLSGAEGFTVNEAYESKVFPLAKSLINIDSVSLKAIFSTKLFKPGTNSDEHIPVHKVILEYCAASYLVNKITDPTNDLTLSQCMPVIAPNMAIRMELRGLIGWMATLGNKSIQEAIISLDPYSVISNGDVSQLFPSSKTLLINKLKELEDTDPYFRRSDFGRRFIADGLFTDETIEAIRPILNCSSESQLKNLLLELLVGSKVTYRLVDELKAIVNFGRASQNSRIYSLYCLLEIEAFDPHDELLSLIEQSTYNSLSLAALIIKHYPCYLNSTEALESFFRSCINLFSDRDTGTRASKYFVKTLIEKLPEEPIEKLLSIFAKELICTCDKTEFECNCKEHLSKIMGALLDRYFDVITSPADPIKVWSWTKNLEFPDRASAKEFNAIQVLRTDTELRCGILSHVFGNLTDYDEIVAVKRDHFGIFKSHSGLTLTEVDKIFIVDLAYNNNNTALWQAFIANHNFYSNEEHQQGLLRKHMRSQAKCKPDLMKLWIAAERNAACETYQQDLTWRNRTQKRFRRRKRAISKKHTSTQQWITANRSLIEQGQHWGILGKFSYYYLDRPDKIQKVYGDKEIVSKALIACIPFLKEKLTTLKQLGKKNASQPNYITFEKILTAAALEYFSAGFKLVDLDRELLQMMRFILGHSYSSEKLEEIKVVKAGIDAIIFSEPNEAEFTLREYVEPQLSLACNDLAEVSLLKQDTFKHLQEALSIEWLERFHGNGLLTCQALFGMAYKHTNNRDRLERLIASRCRAITRNFGELNEVSKFWLIRAFYFLPLSGIKAAKDILLNNKDTVFIFAEHHEFMYLDGSVELPELTADKIGAILYAYVEIWPKVHLSSNSGIESPAEEKAYRFLKNVIWKFTNEHSDGAIAIVSTLINDPKFINFKQDLKSIKAEQLRNKALHTFSPPSPSEITELLDNNKIVNVEGMRQLVIQELSIYQNEINGGEFNARRRFYSGEKRCNEVNCMQVIAERLSHVFKAKNIAITVEHQTKNENRIDITTSKFVDGKKLLLPLEGKGQWHPDLYTAPEKQLYDKYSIHPDAAGQGIYLVVWFGVDEIVAGLKNKGITSAEELKANIISKMPAELKPYIDVFVLDVSRE